MHSVTDRHDVIVVGGGQAGLAMGYFLAREGRDFTILEAAQEPAAAWRRRWDSLKLFTPVRYSSWVKDDAGHIAGRIKAAWSPPLAEAAVAQEEVRAI